MNVAIYDLDGRLVATHYSDSKPSSFVPLNKGDSEQSEQGVSASAQGIIIWQPDEFISSGVYLVRATTNDGQITKRVVYLK